MRIPFYLTLSLLVVSEVLVSNSASALDLQRMLDRFARKNHIPGVELSVMKGGGDVKTFYTGWSNLEQRRSLNKKSIFRIASVSKQFTTQAIMLLKEQGKLDTADKLSKYFPDFPNADRVTLKNMLQHTSGLPEIEDVKAFGDNEAKEWTPQEIISLVRDQPYQFEPGTQASYCNTNFVMLGLIIEQVSGKSFAEFLRDNIIKPLSMTRTRVGSDSAIIHDRVAGYVYADGKYTNAQFVSVVAPFATGDIMSRPLDFVRLALPYRQGKSPFFSDASIEEITAPVILNNGTLYISGWLYPGYDVSFGYGLELIRRIGTERWIVTKGGSINGFKTLFAYFPRSDTAIAIAGNSEQSPYDFVMKIARVLKLRA